MLVCGVVFFLNRKISNQSQTVDALQQKVEALEKIIVQQQQMLSQHENIFRQLLQSGGGHSNHPQTSGPLNYPQSLRPLNQPQSSSKSQSIPQKQSRMSQQSHVSQQPDEKQKRRPTRDLKSKLAREELDRQVKRINIDELLKEELQDLEPDDEVEENEGVELEFESNETPLNAEKKSLNARTKSN